MTELSFETMEPVIVKVRVTDAAFKRQQQLSNQGCCIGCERRLEKDETPRRGLCDACYQAARRAVKTKKITETQLVREGKLLTPGRRGRPTTNKFTRELSEL